MMVTTEINYAAMEMPETYVPAHMRAGYKRWIEHGISPGSFGKAILENDLIGACSKADTDNQNHIYTTVKWFYNYAPESCWRSVENVKKWKGLT